MPEATTDHSVEQEMTKKQWQTPVLTLLGDARTLTGVGGMAAPDSPATSAVS